ncbi:MAG: RIP metalloprotease RseP [Gammaproteobacteria bacterium]|nr:RIP metalloprotease RseP [Gammaproteobacteria bacterium]
MFEVFLYPVSFIIALAILIAVHEFGHFWVARRCGVKVLKFSIGFGKPIWQRKSKVDGTEYILAAIPLGGYVKMLDERESEVEEIEKPLAFNNKPVWARFLIVAAGPAFNFIFAIIVLWVMYMSGIHGLKAMVGKITPASYASKAGFEYGDQIQKIDGKITTDWNRVRLALLNAALDEETINISVLDKDNQPKIRNMNLSGLSDPVEQKDLIKAIGLSYWSPLAELGEPVKAGPAYKAGLKEGDVVIQVDDKPVKFWSEWVQSVRDHPSSRIMVKVERDGSILSLPLDVGAMEKDGKTIGLAEVRLPKRYWSMLEVEIEYNPVEALQAGIVRTWDMSVLMLRVLGRIVIGESSLRNISGPLTIAQYAGDTASLGIVPFLSFLAIVSISLGVLNLLPIPVLDGGHLFYYIIEMITGKQVSEQFQSAAQQLGIFLLVALMGLAFYNDILRLFS